MNRFIFISFSLFCFGCAPDFSGADIHIKENHPSPISLKSFSLKVNDQLITPSPEIITAYNSSLSKADINADCEVHVSIQETINTEKENLWYLGVALMIPFWPAMPMNTFLRLESTVEIMCQENLIHRLDFLEEEELDLFWYGPFRTYEIENRFEWFHEKMIKRLENALQYESPVDAGCASDF